ncbi:MAG TPA: 2-amino-5-chloromuconate deaminase, partial [Rhodospirillaceae bacterium]|nr:2-amino-5-chloromuconate deaminase [Rhodospirillaceae bacterium]
MTDPLDLPLETLIPMLQKGECAADDVIAAASARHETFGDQLQAYLRWDPAPAVAGGGVLAGIPVSAKDLFGLEGFETFAGSPSPLPANWCVEGPVVAALKSAGATIMGKTHMVEFAFGGIGTNPHWPTPANPWDVKTPRVPGGSSSGAGVSIWEGSALVALGSDTAGSVRVPASFTGTVGLKTTKGCWSTDGLVPLSTSLDTPGLLTRSAADMAVAFSVIDPDKGEPFERFLATLRERDLSDIKLGLCRWFFEDCDPGIAETIEASVAKLEKAGASVAEITLPSVVEAGEIFGRGGLAAPEFAALINDQFADWKPTLDPNVLARFERMEAIPAIDYISRRNRLAELAAEADQALESIDALIGPTVPITPPTVEAVSVPEEYFRCNMATLRNTSIVNLLDQCAVSLPVGLDKAGMPVGLHLIGRNGADREIISVALAAEKILGTARE